MGTLQQNFVNAIVYESNSDQVQVGQLKKFVENHNEICVRLPTLTNGVTNYLMGWDGSKEGWETSDKYDDIRIEFLDLLKSVNAYVWSVIDGDYYEDPIVKREQ